MKKKYIAPRSERVAPAPSVDVMQLYAAKSEIRRHQILSKEKNLWDEYEEDDATNDYWSTWDD